MESNCRIDEVEDAPHNLCLNPGQTSAGIDPRRMTCPACGCEQENAQECIRCGIVFKKYLAKVSPAAASLPASSTNTVQSPAARRSATAWMLVLPLLLICRITVFIWPENSPVPHGPGVCAPHTPVQRPIDNPQKFVFKNYQITPLAAFEIEARVLSARRYRSGREAELSPIDLALGWGRMSDDNVLKDIEIRQSGRFFYWRVEQFPIPRKEIEENSANMHIIPATRDITRRLKKIRKGCVVRFNGYLVRVDARDQWHWQSSLTRKDTGDGACELVWVEQLDII